MEFQKYNVKKKKKKKKESEKIANEATDKELISKV